MREEHIEKDKKIDQSVSADESRGCRKMDSKDFRARERIV